MDSDDEEEHVGGVVDGVLMVDRDRYRYRYRIRGARGVLDRELDIQSNPTHLKELIEW